MENYLQLIDNDQPVSLLVIATASDVREAVQYLKRKPDGLTSIEAMDAVRRRTFDPRKVTAYELWGVITRTNDRLKLTPLGWDLARCLAPEAQIFRIMIDNTAPYRSVLGWILQRNLELVTFTDVLTYWQQHYPQFFDQEDEKTLEAGVGSFFQLCQAADLGMATLGRKSQPTRLRVHHDELSAYLSIEKPVLTVNQSSGSDQQTKARTPPAQNASPQLALPVVVSNGLRLLITHHLKPNIAHPLQEMFAVIGIESEVIERRVADRGTPLAEDMLQAMRRCAAAIIIISSEDCHDDSHGELVLKESVLVEIGAAFVHFEHRVQLLWEEKIPLPASLSNLSYCEFEGDELRSWETGSALIKSVKDFEHSFQDDAHQQRPVTAAAEINSTP